VRRDTCQCGSCLRDCRQLFATWTRRFAPRRDQEWNLEDPVP
jgi:hypothetical protein